MISSRKAWTTCLTKTRRWLVRPAMRSTKSFLVIVVIIFPSMSSARRRMLSRVGSSLKHEARHPAAMPNACKSIMLRCQRGAFKRISQGGAVLSSLSSSIYQRNRAGSPGYGRARAVSTRHGLGAAGLRFPGGFLAFAAFLVLPRLAAAAFLVAARPRLAFIVPRRGLGLPTASASGNATSITSSIRLAKMSLRSSRTSWGTSSRSG